LTGWRCGESSPQHPQQPLPLRQHFYRPDFFPQGGPAFRVILLDTLSIYLDPATFRPGAASHRYRYELTESGVLRFYFQPIALPHSSVNEPGSNGFVTFRIAQKRDNPVGTLIENRAGIYFDFNLPVITNTVFHTVHAPWLKLVHVGQPGVAPMLSFSAFSNPFAGQVTVRLEGAKMPGTVLRLFGTDGRMVQEMPFRQNQLTLDRKGLPAGMYFFSVEARGKGAGKWAVGSGVIFAFGHFQRRQGLKPCRRFAFYTAS